MSSPVDKYAKVPFRSKQVTVPTRLCYHASMITFVPANYEVTFFYNVDRISTVLVFLTRTMPDWCGHAWPTGPGQNESQEGPEPVHLSKNTRTVERLLKPTRTVERFATSRPLASAGRSIIPPAISRATPCPCTPLGRSCVKGRARADSRHHRRRRPTGPRGVRYLLTADGAPCMHARRNYRLLGVP